MFSAPLENKNDNKKSLVFWVFQGSINWEHWPEIDYHT